VGLFSKEKIYKKQIRKENITKKNRKKGYKLQEAKGSK